MMTITKADIVKQVDKILSSYSGKRDEIMPILEETQEQFGYLPADAMQRIAKYLHVSDSIVF